MKRHQNSDYVKYLLIVLCSIFLIYEIITVEDYVAVYEQFVYSSSESYVFFVVALFLLPLNIILEAFKWKTLLSNTLKINLRDSIKSVVWGYTGAFITPNSIGEFPARVLVLPPKSRKKNIALGFVGVLIQTTVITICGFGALFVNGSRYQSFSLPLILIILTILILLILVIFNFRKVYVLISKKRVKTLDRIYNTLKDLSLNQVVRLFIFSFLKYIVFSSQFLFIMLFCGINIPIKMAFVEMPIFYLFLTYMPVINILEIAVRGTLAIFIFGKYSDSSLLIIIASTIFWIMNFCIPTFIGLFLGKNRYYDNR